MAKHYDSLLRLLLVGNQGVGKTCLMCQYTCNEFHENYLTTIGIDFKMKIIDLDGKTVKVQIWDTAGQERFEAITKQSCIRAQGCALVYDISSKQSFESLRKWLLFVQRYAKEDIPIIVIGNKTDLDERQVSTAIAQQFANENDFKYYETSAKDPESLKYPFEDLCREILKANPPTTSTDSDKIDLRASHHDQGVSTKMKAVQREDKATNTSGRKCC